MNNKPWRIIENEWNLKGAPWSGAIGIEEVDEALAVPGVVCWFTRGWDNEAAAQRMVHLHNKDLDKYQRRAYAHKYKAGLAYSYSDDDNAPPST